MNGETGTNLPPTPNVEKPPLRRRFARCPSFLTGWPDPLACPVFYLGKFLRRR